MSRYVRQQHPADSAGGAAGRVIDVSTRLGLFVRLAEDPNVQPSELNSRSAGFHPRLPCLHLL